MRELIAIKEWADYPFEFFAFYTKVLEIAILASKDSITASKVKCLSN